MASGQTTITGMETENRLLAPHQTTMSNEYSFVPQNMGGSNDKKSKSLWSSRRTWR